MRPFGALMASQVASFIFLCCRYLLYKPDAWSVKTTASVSQWLEWENALDLDAAKPNFTKAESWLSSYSQGFSAASIDCVLFGAIYATQSLADVAASYPALSSWFKRQSTTAAYAEAIKEFQQQTSAVHARHILPGIERPQKPAASNHVPVPGERNILITSALPYVNNVPHLGNIIGCVLSADVYARYCRMQGYNTLYICGTDEYGTATETKALAEGVSCQELCDRYHKLHAEVYEWFDIDFDIFGRTATPIHTQISQDIFLKLHKKGMFSTDTVSQLYCANCDRFLADRYVEGICPLCDYPDARGDQCDGCQKLLNPVELKEPRCKMCGQTPELKDSAHMFLNLPQMQEKVKAFVEKSSQEGAWSPNGTAIAHAWLQKELQPRCITRDLKWGTPVPLKEMDGKVLYVWFDAPIGYLSITANYTKEWQKWWLNPKDVKLYQFMGKDNVAFHTVIFPATLLGTDEPYTMLHHLSTTGKFEFIDHSFTS